MSTSNDPVNWHLINVIWGKEYLDTFLTISLPSQLAKGNIPNLPPEITATYKIYLDRETKKSFLASPLFTLLQRYLRIECIEISPLTKHPAHTTLTTCHIHAIKNGQKENAVLIFLSPDCVFSTGVFTYYYHSLQNGKRLIASPGVRLSKEGMVKTLTDQSLLPTKELSLSSDQLTSLALKNLHPITLFLFWEKNKIPEHPSHLYWWLDKDTILLRPFHIHPFVLFPKKCILPKESIDDAFIGKAIPDRSQWDIIRDSRNCSVFELSKNNQFLSADQEKLSTPDLYYWVRNKTSLAHRYFVSHKFYIGTGKRSPEWEKIEIQSDKALELAIPKKFLPQKNPKLFFRKILFFFYYLYRRYLRMPYHILSRKKKVTIKQLYRHFFPINLDIFIPEVIKNREIFSLKKSISVKNSLPKIILIGGKSFIGKAFLSFYSRHPNHLWTTEYKHPNPLHRFDLQKPNFSLLPLSGEYHYALLAAANSTIYSCEKNPTSSRLCNVLTPLAFGRKCTQAKVIPTFFSSDYVFDGKKEIDYEETSPVNPQTEYGRQKAELEKKVPYVCCNCFLLFRLSKVYGGRKGDGSFLDKVVSTLLTQKSFRAAADQIFRPIYVCDVVKAIIETQRLGLTGIFNLCGREVWSLYEIAIAVAKTLGMPTDRVEKISVDDLKEPFSRPKNLTLSCVKLANHIPFTLTPLSSIISSICEEYTRSDQDYSPSSLR